MRIDQTATIVQILVESANNKVRLKVAASKSTYDDHQEQIEVWERRTYVGLDALLNFLEEHPIPKVALFALLDQAFALTNWLEEPEHAAYKRKLNSAVL